MEIVSSDTAIVITDPQNDFLSPDGATWGLVGANAEANNTVENLQRLLETAQANGYTVFVSPHYYYPTDHGWQFGGTVEVMMHDINMFDRAGALTVDGFKVPVVKDATAAAQHEDLGDGYAAALVNFGYLASEVLSTDEAVARLS